MAGTIKHQWNGTILTITSDSGTSSMDLKGDKGDTGARGVQGLQGKMGGGALIADGIISSDTTWSSAEIMDNFAEQMAVKDNPVVCQPIPNYPLHIITDIEPKQSGSGEPYPGGSNNKQLYDVYSNTSGVSVDNDDWITIEYDNTSGTSTSYKSVYTPPSNRLTTNKRYKIFVEVKELSGGYLQVVGAQTASNKAQFSETFEFNGISGTSYRSIYTREDFTGCATMLRTNLCIRAGENGKAVFRISVVDDDAITLDNFVYTKYANIRPISGMDAVNVVRCGKNLVGYDYEGGTIQGVSITKNADGYYTLNGTALQSGIAILEDTILPPGTYTLSLEVASGSCSTEQQTAGQLDYADTNTIATVVRPNIRQAKHTYKESTRARVRLFVNSGTTYNSWKIRISLAAGTEPANQPYNGNTFTMSIGETIYGGSIDWNTGVMTVNKKCVTIVGADNEGWKSGTASGMPYTAELLSNVKTSTGYPIYGICSHFPSKKGIILSANIMCAFKNYGLQLNQAGAELLGIEWTLTAWKSYLQAQSAAGKPLQICYELEMPYEVALTAQEIKAISGVNTLYTDAAEISVLGRVDTMYQLSQLAARIAALEAAMIGG